MNANLADIERRLAKVELNQRKLLSIFYGLQSADFAIFQAILASHNDDMDELLKRSRELTDRHDGISTRLEDFAK